jgi:hypothetical protein
MSSRAAVVSPATAAFAKHEKAAETGGFLMSRRSRYQS